MTCEIHLLNLEWQVNKILQSAVVLGVLSIMPDAANATPLSPASSPKLPTTFRVSGEKSCDEQLKSSFIRVGVCNRVSSPRVKEAAQNVRRYWLY